MADGVVVSALLELKDKLSPGMGAVARAMSGMNTQVERGQQSLQQMQGTAQDVKGTLLSLAASVGASFGAMELAKSFVESNAEVERAQKKISGLLSSVYEFDKDPTKNFRMGMDAARRMVEDFDAAESEIGVDKGDMLQMAEALAPAFGRAGRSLKEISPFVTQLASKSVGLGVDMQTMAQSVQTALAGGRVGPELKKLGVTAKAMDEAKSGAAKLALITKSLKLLPDEELRKVQTWDDLVRRIRISVGNIMEEGGAPFFEAAKDAAAKVLKYLSENKETLVKIAKDVGDKFVTLLDKAVTATQYLLENFDGIYETAKTIGIAIAGWKLAGAVAGMGGGIASMTAALGPAAATFGAGAAAAFGAGAATLQAGIVGYAIGDSLRRYLETTSWWTNMWDTVGFAFSSEIRKAEHRDEEFERILGRFESTIYSSISARKAETPEQKAAVIRDLLPKYRGMAEGGYTEQSLLLEFARRNKLDLGATPATADGKPRKQDVYDFRGSRFDITQKFAEGFDPDRIAVAFAQDLGRMGEMRVQSAMAPTAGLVR